MFGNEGAQNALIFNSNPPWHIYIILDKFVNWLD